MIELLKIELETYKSQKNNLLAKANGKFALIKGEKVFDVFDSKMDAIRLGYENFGNVPFLVKQILEVETPLSFTSNSLGF